MGMLAIFDLTLGHREMVSGLWQDSYEKKATHSRKQNDI